MNRLDEKFVWNKILICALWVVSISSIFLVVWWRFVYALDVPRSWDQVDFSLALTRFDLFAMQPHFPGYPYFILGGMLINEWVVNPTQALANWNSLLLLTTVYPIYKLSRSYLWATGSVVAVAIIQSMVFLNVMAVQPMSEAAAVAILWWYIWILQSAFERKNSTVFVVLSSLLFSFLLGIRLSYLPFGIGLLLLLLSRKKQFKTREYASFLIIQISIALLFQLIWVAGLAVSEGGVAAFIQLALGFSNGHFQDWGGTAVSASSSILERLSNLLFYNIAWTGFAGQSTLLLGVIALFSVYAAVALVKRIRKSSGTPFVWAYVAMFIGYFLWALFAQNVDKPRHILPLPTMALFGLATIIVSEHTLRTRVMVFLLIVVVTQTTFSYGVMKEAEKPAAVHQLIDYLEEINEPVIVYTWEETRVMGYVDADFEHEQIYTYSTFRSDKRYYENHRIFLTGEVVDGFKEQGIPIENSIKRVINFDSSSLYDPVYDNIVLYEYRE
ncbi:hypothetical protein Q9251_06425 [Alkalihalobacillus macyae]|uniref:hypothetical protein n=1 Tax=Guptibacillus hwajinpoensis TaxID=208199 RepID=UPI00273C59DD|nr:hypothetical protein [Alkalihalobacillus macyae]MDP4550512.1 hypothetical protein [Alkalihalobacillus macyae]